jgi:hypothetical protein
MHIQSAENCSQLKADKSQSNPADGSGGQWYAGRDRNNKPDHLTAHGNRSASTSETVAGLPDEEFQGHANSCRSGSGPFGACTLPDVFELRRLSVFTSVLTLTKVLDTGKLHNEFTRTPNACEADVASQSADTIKLSFTKHWGPRFTPAGFSSGVALDRRRRVLPRCPMARFRSLSLILTIHRPCCGTEPRSSQA